MKLLYLLTGFLFFQNILPVPGSAADPEPLFIIRGRILTADGTPAGNVTVLIKNTRRGTVTNQAGEFIFRRLTAGKYTLQVSLVDYESTELNVEVGAKETETVQLQLRASDKELEEVIVRASQNRLIRKESDYVARMPLKNVENPQVYNVVGQALMREQVITSFDDALKNAPGVNRLWTSTGRSGDGAGFFSMRGFSVQPTMINGIAGLTNGGIDPANIERIESIKGPSGTLFGSSLISFGGLLNIVTKKPYQDFGGEVTYTAGGFGLSRITADINTPVNQEKTALFRLNTAYHYEGSFQDAGYRKSIFVAPSFSYKVNDKLSFNINTEFFSGRSTNTLMVFLNRTRQLKARTPKELGIDFNRSFTSNDLTIATPTVNLYGQINYKLSDKWHSQTNLSRSLRQSDGYYSYIMFLDAGTGTPAIENDTLLSRYITNQTASSTTTDLQQNFIGDFYIGGMRSRLVLGLDFLNIQTKNNNTPYIFDLVSSIRVNDPRYTLFNKQIVDQRLGQTTAANTRNFADGYTYSAYASEVLNVTELLIAMASVRLDHFDNKGSLNHATNVWSGKYSQTSVSPKLGLVYQVVKDRIGVFVNYMNGFRNVAPVTQPLPELSGVFKPQQANQTEGGIKLDALNNKVSFTASYYDLKVTNLTRPASIVVDGTTYNYTIQDGSQRSRGIELDLAATPAPGMNLIAGYSHNSSKMTESDKNIQGRRPVSAGPENLANVWISYTAQRGSLQGLGAGLGGNYASENKITNDLRTGVFTLPSYTIINATVFYTISNLRLAIKADNLVNKEYFGGWTTVEKQLPRRFSGSIALRF